MSDWISQYSAALDERDAREKAHKSYIDAYTKLADRTAALEQAGPPTTIPSQPSEVVTTSGRATSSRPQGVKSPATVDPTAINRSNTPDLLAQLRADLATTQRSRQTLQSQLTSQKVEFEALSLQSTTSAQKISALTREKRDLERRLRDRDEEVKTKQRLVEHVHDEMAGLNLELNMVVERERRVKGENEMLVRRWMDKMGEEAERMNKESQWR